MSVTAARVRPRKRPRSRRSRTKGTIESMSRAPDKLFNVKLPEDKGKFGANQRLRFVVPTPATTLVLGQRWADDPPFGFSGASLRTTANLFVDIKERTLFQGHSTVTFQTTETWT